MNPFDIPDKVPNWIDGREVTAASGQHLPKLSPVDGALWRPVMDNRRIVLPDPGDATHYVSGLGNAKMNSGQIVRIP